MEIKEIDKITYSNQTRQINQEENISEKEMSLYKEVYDKESLIKKKKYLHMIKENNNKLISKIKEFDQKVNVQVNILTKKFQKRNVIIPKFEEMQTKALRQKFQQFQKLRKQLESKRSGKNSLQFLLDVKKKYEIKLNEINKDLSGKRKEIQNLKKIKSKSLIAQHNIKNQVASVGNLDIFGFQIEQLKYKVKQKKQSIKSKKEEFLSLYKQNRSNKSIVLQNSPKQKQIEIDPQLIQLKNQYESLGKKVDLLKLKKSKLLNQIKSTSDQSKILQRLRSKYDNLTKMTK